MEEGATWYQQGYKRQLARKEEKTKKDPLYWVHPPKTGSSFCLTLAHEICPKEFEREAAKLRNGTTKVTLRKGCALLEGLNCPVGGSGHGPLDLTRSNTWVIIVMREPRLRLLSSYDDHVHHEGLLGSMPESKEWMRKREMVLEACRSIDKKHSQECAQVKNSNAYFTMDSFKHCYTKMFNGVWCSAPYNVTTAMRDLALARMSEFYFIGLLEDWNNSITLFNLMRGSEVIDAELAHMRKAGKDVTQRIIVASEWYKEWRDPHDTALYEYGILRHNEMRSKYGLEPYLGYNYSALYGVDDRVPWQLPP